MQFGASQSLWLSLLLVIVPVAVIVYPRNRRHPASRRIIWLSLTISAVLIVIAMSRLYVITHGTLTIAVDLSRSTQNSPWRNPNWVRDLARAHLPGNTHVRVIGFASRTSELWQGNLQQDWPARWANDDLGVTTVIPVMQNRHPIWYITDGLANWPEFHHQQTAATLLSPTSGDFGITSAESFYQDTTGTSAVAVDVCATTAGTVRLLARNHDQILTDQPLIFERAGKKQVMFSATPGVIQIQLITRDPWPDDDSAQIMIAPSQSAPPLTISKQQPLKQTVAELSATPLIILRNPDQFWPAPNEISTLEQYVRDTGGSLLILGGRQRCDELLATLSPITHQSPHRKPQSFWFILDASGSMNQPDAQSVTRAERAIAAAVRASAVISPADRSHLLIFNNTCQILASGTGPLSLPSQRITPTGPTIPDSVLPVLEQQLDPQATVILLTDGEIPTMNIARWHTLLNQRQAQLIVIAPKQTGHTLEQLAAGHRWEQSNSADTWATLLKNILTQAISGNYRDDPITWQSRTNAPLRGVTRSWVEGWHKPMSEPIVTHDELTIAATWQYGLGRVTAINFADASPAYDSFVAQIAQQTHAPANDRRFTLAAYRHDKDWRVVAQAQDRSVWLNDLALTLACGKIRAALRQTAPGQYEGRIPISATESSAMLLIKEQNIVTRLMPPLVAPPESPAVTPQGQLPADIVMIQPDSAIRWQPLPTYQHDLSAYCWLASLLGLLTACLLHFLRHLFSHTNVIRHS